MSKRILVADDERDTSDFLKKTLERRGFQVSVCYDGWQAKSLLEKDKFDVLLLDCNMPGACGSELITLAKEKNTATKIIVFTGYSAQDDSVAQGLDIDAFLEKPLSFEAIEQAIK